VSDLSTRVEHSIRDRRLFVRHQRILVAVSGGVDSMVLLHVLQKLAAKYGWRLKVAHLNHQLRGRSGEADERLVRRTAAELGLAVRVARADVRRFARAHNLSLEMAARKLRHDFLARTAARLRIPTVALAHHADDQMELFFLRLLRGSGGEGLAGMKWRNGSPSNPGIELVRPLLDQPKSALQDHAAEARLRFREDATNALLDIQRNRIRHELLPLLRKEYQPALDKTVSRVMEIVGAEADYVTAAALLWLDRASRNRQRSRRNADRGRVKAQHERTALKMPGPATVFEDLPVAVQRRSLQLQLLRQGIAADFDLVERLRTNANKPVSIGPRQRRPDRFTKPRRLIVGEPAAQAGAGSCEGGEGKTPATLDAVRDTAGVVTLQARHSEAFISNVQAVDLGSVAGTVEFGGVKIHWQVDSKRRQLRPQCRSGREFFDADSVGSHIRLRHWRPGDRFQPIGMAHAVKLQDFFTNLKVPRCRRRKLVLAETADGQVFWVEGMRISDRFKLSKQTIRCLQWRWEGL
jgi:tRNA(Ile)-lysidine synthase